jgi:ParB family chromosome partitioning protein
MTSPPAVRHIPLDQLVPSPTNVRKTPPSAAEDAELKASIRTRGLKPKFRSFDLNDSDHQWLASHLRF